MNISFISGVSHILPRKWSFMGSSSVEIKPDFFEKESEHIADVQIYKKNGILKKPVLASIYKTGEAKKEKYTMVRNDKILGDIEIKADEPDIFVINVESYARDEYSGIGTKLMQIAAEKSLQSGHTKHVLLNAQKLHLVQRHPKGFYQKLGFKVQNIKPEEIKIYGIPMDLSVTQEPFWIEKIKNEPVLKNNFLAT